MSKPEMFDTKIVLLRYAGIHEDLILNVDLLMSKFKGDPDIMAKIRGGILYFGPATSGKSRRNNAYLNKGNYREEWETTLYTERDLWLRILCRCNDLGALEPSYYKSRYYYQKARKKYHDFRRCNETADIGARR